MLTIHEPAPGNEDDFCAGVEGEIAVPGMVCDRPGCGCEFAHCGLNSKSASSQVMVREVDLSLDDLTVACAGMLENAGWASTFDSADELHECARGLVSESAEVATGYPVGTILRPLFDFEQDEWGYTEVTAA